MILTSENIGDWVTRPAWDVNVMVRVTAVGERKILVDRGNGYEDVLLNDGQFRIVYSKKEREGTRV